MTVHPECLRFGYIQDGRCCGHAPEENDMPRVDHHPHTFRTRYPSARHLEAHILELHRRSTDGRPPLADLENWHADLHHTGIADVGHPHWHEHPDGNPKFTFPEERG